MSGVRSLHLGAPRALRDGIITLLPAVYPLCLILGVVAVPGGSILLRVGLVAAAATGLLHLGRITPTHRRWFAILALYLVAIALSSIVSADRSLALADLLRQVFVAFVAAGLSLALADRRARTAFALGAAAIMIATTVGILILYSQVAGVAQIQPGQESFKALAGDRGSLLNAASFAAVLAAILAVPYLARRPVTLLLLLPVALAVIASGSRTTLVSLIAAVPLFAGLLLLDRIPRLPGWAKFGSVGVAAGWAVLTSAEHLGRLVLSPAMNELTTGRSLLWAAAWEKFLARPWFGWGGGTFPVDLGSFLPTGIKVYQAEDLVVLGVSGGAHNALLTTLAERGVLGGLAAAAMIAFLVYLSLRVFRSRKRLARSDRVLAWLAPFAVVLILVRSLGESPGWFGGADGLVDFLAYGFAAVLVGLAADLVRGGEPIREPGVAAPG